MFKKPLLCLSLVMFTLLSVETPFATAENRIVTVGVYENAPKIFTAESGQPAGIFIDIIEYIAKKEGWTLRYVTGTWSQQLARLEKGEIDLMPDVAFTTAREKIYAFHKVPVISSWDKVYGRKGSGIQSLLDLNRKQVVVLEKSVQHEEFVNLVHSFGLNVNIMLAPNFKTAFEIVARGEADAAIANHFYGAMHAKEFGLEDTAVLFNPSALFFVAPKGTHEELLLAIDGHLSELKKDSQSMYYSSLKRWTFEEVKVQFPVWLQILGLVLGVALIMSLLGSFLLRHQVNARTRELQQINREMEQRILDRTAELATAMQKAQAADQIKSAFLATMSHELRTPLNSIIGFTGIILRERVGPLNDEQKKQLNMVRRSSQHLLALINDVLDISKIEAGQLQLVSEQIDIRQIVEKVVQSTRPLAEGKGLELAFEMAPDMDTITGDPRRVEQILLNLLSNAIKFTEQGSVRIVCEEDAANVMLQVMDTGIGIKAEDMDKVFQSFRQIDSGLTRKYDGTGLGLSISKRLVELMGGRIWITSVWGSGSTFAFSLPKERRNV